MAKLTYMYEYHMLSHELLLDHFGVDYQVDFQTTNEPKSVFTDFIKVRREELKNVKKNVNVHVN